MYLKIYAGNLVAIFYYSYPRKHISTLSLHLYSLFLPLSLPLPPSLFALSTVKEPTQELCELFLWLDSIIQSGNARNYWPWVVVYNTLLRSIEEYTQNGRLEEEFRKTNSGPHNVPNWSRRRSYGCRTHTNVILVIGKNRDD